MPQLPNALGLAVYAALGLTSLTLACQEQEPTGVLLREIAGRQAVEATLGDFSPDGKTVAISLPARRMIGIWQTSSGKLDRTLATRGILTVRTGEPSPSQLAFSPDGRWLAAALGTLYHGHLILWDLHTGAPAWANAEVTGIHSFPLAFTPDSKELATTGRPDLKSTADVTFWDTSHGKARQAVSIRAAGEWSVQALAFAADGKRWASTQLVENPSAKRRGEWSSVVSIWDRRADKPLRTWSAGSGQVHSLSFTARGDLLVGRCRFPDHLEVWDSRSGALRHSFALGAKASGAVAV